MSGWRLRWALRGRRRAVVHVLLLTVVFLTVNTQVAWAATGGGSQEGGLLAPLLQIKTSEGIPLSGYQMGAGGSSLSMGQSFRVMVIGGLFTLVVLLVGLACWMVEFAFRFPLLSLLMEPAQKAADAYNDAVVDQLGLKGLMLSWGFAFGLILFVRGRAARGLGEIALTLLLGAFAASAFIRPDVLLGVDGPLVSSQRAGAEVSQAVVDSYDWGGKVSRDLPGPCATNASGAEVACSAGEEWAPVKPGSQAAAVARPIQDAVTNAIVVKPFMLLQYGQLLDPGKKDEKAAYEAHVKWVTGKYAPMTKAEAEEECKDVATKPMRDLCVYETLGKTPPLTPVDVVKEKLQEGTAVLSPEDQALTGLTNDLKKNGGAVGKEAAAYASDPSWERVSGALVLLLAAILVAGMLMATTMVLLGAQAGGAGASAVGGVVFVWSMLPGPNRQIVWKWLGLWLVATLATFAACLFVPFYGMSVDAVLTDGPDLMIERLLLLVALALLGVFFHRALFRALSGFGQRLAQRMRYLKVGGTHLPGDTSEIGAALGAHAAGGYGVGGGLAMPGAYGLGTRHGLLSRAGAMLDGSGMPMDPGAVVGQGLAEARRGLAPLGLAVGAGALGAKLGLRGAHGLLVGRRPDQESLDRMRRPVATGDTRTPRPSWQRYGGGHGQHEGSEERELVDPQTGEVVRVGGDNHGEDERTGLGTRVHNRAVRLRGYRVLSRAGRLAYHSTYGLPAAVSKGSSRATQDARDQWTSTRTRLQEDGQAWRPVGRTVARAGRGAVTLSQRAAVTGHLAQQQAAESVGRIQEAGHRGAARVRAGARSASLTTALVLGRTANPPSSASRPVPGAVRQVSSPSDDHQRVLDALARARESGSEDGS
ncbi:hypothetical protein [Streptomyces diastaticus]|uniref:hypothetical protein n=1 Tax=Streptomyces diastaticus TaxID=1956 RepID=UPI00382F54C4